MEVLRLQRRRGDAAVDVLALVACTRCRVEEFFEDGKSYPGMTQYETRSWVGWHHHMTLVGLAHLFVTRVRKRLKKNAGADVGPDSAASGGSIRGAGAEVAAGDGAGGLPRAPEQGCPKVAFSYQAVRYPLDMRISTAYYSNRSVQKSPSQGLALLKW